jgi:hypothetical protein
VAQSPHGVQVRKAIVSGTIGGLAIVAAEKLGIGPWLYLPFVLGVAVAAHLAIDLWTSRAGGARNSN